MKKQILSLFLCFCLILGCMPAAVRAEGEQHIFFKGVERDDVSENWFVDSTVRPLTSRSFYVDFNYGLQFVDEDGTLITGDIGDIEVDDETVCTVEEMGRLDNCFLIVGNAAGSAGRSFRSRFGRRSLRPRLQRQRLPSGDFHAGRERLCGRFRIRTGRRDARSVRIRPFRAQQRV